MLLSVVPIRNPWGEKGVVGYKNEAQRETWECIVVTEVYIAISSHLIACKLPVNKH